MKKIKVGQLVRIKGFGKGDAIYGKPLEKLLIGQTGRFVARMKHDDIVSLSHGTVGGEFEFEPDVQNQNQYLPCFSHVYVEPVDEP